MLSALFKDYSYYIYSSPAIKEKNRGGESGGLLILAKNKSSIERKVIENNNLWIFLEYICKDSKYVIGCVYFRPNLDTDECLKIIHDSLNFISEIYQYHKIINDHIGQLNQVEEEIFQTSKVKETTVSFHNARKL